MTQHGALRHDRRALTPFLSCPVEQVELSTGPPRALPNVTIGRVAATEPQHATGGSGPLDAEPLRRQS